MDICRICPVARRENFYGCSFVSPRPRRVHPSVKEEGDKNEIRGNGQKICAEQCMKRDCKSRSFTARKAERKKNDEVELEAQCHYDMGERSLACWTISPFKPVRRQRRSTAHPNGWGSAQAPTETGIIQGDMGSHGSLGALFAGLEGFKSGRALLWLVWAMLVGWAGNWLDWQDWLGAITQSYSPYSSWCDQDLVDSARLASLVRRLADWLTTQATSIIPEVALSSRPLLVLLCVYRLSHPNTALSTVSDYRLWRVMRSCITGTDGYVCSPIPKYSIAYSVKRITSGGVCLKNDSMPI